MNESTAPMGTRDCGHEIAMSAPAAGEGGNTGDWRTSRPVLEPARCLAVKQRVRPPSTLPSSPPRLESGRGSQGEGEGLTCQLCWVYCPDVCVARGAPPAVDLRYCKGCGICAEVCPADAIRMVSEDAAEGGRP